MGETNFTVTFEENRGSILENIIKDTLIEYFRQHPTESITDEQLGAILGEYLTNHPIEGVSSEEVNSAIESYMQNHPIEGVSTEAINTAVESYMQNNPIASGEDGKSAFQIAVENGFSGTESEWLASLKGAKGDKGNTGDTGADGKSAYEIAVENGFEGTEAEWLESLKGTIEESYPDYINTEKEAVLSRLKALYDNGNNIVIGFNTDQHMDYTNPTKVNNVIPPIRALRDLTKVYPFDICVLGGDNVYSNTTEGVQTEVKMITSAIEGASCPVVNLVGNHDYSNRNVTFDTRNVINSHKSESYKNHVVVTKDRGVNCYYDDTTHKVRFIMLCSVPMSLYYYSETHNFLHEALDSLPDFYSAIIFTHHPIGTFPNTSGNGDNDWHNVLKWNELLTPYADRIIACICGHSHNDKAEIEDGILFISTTCAGTISVHDGTTRVDGTASATAYDVYVINKDTFKVNTVRFGSGSDREVSYYTPTYTNVLPTAIDAEGNIYNGIGTKDTVNIKATGEETNATSTALCRLTGYIRVHPNDVISLKNIRLATNSDRYPYLPNPVSNLLTPLDRGRYVINKIAFFDTNFEPIKILQTSTWCSEAQINKGACPDIHCQIDDGFIKGFTVPNDYDGYMRLVYNSTSDEGIITVNEPIPIKAM